MGQDAALPLRPRVQAGSRALTPPVLPFPSAPIPLALFAWAPGAGVWQASAQTQRGGSPSMSLVTVLKCMPAGDPSGFTGSEDPGAGCVVRSVASAATREAMLNALARGDSGPRASIGARRPGRRRLRLHAPGPTEASPAHGPGVGARGATHCRGPVPRGHGVTAPHPGPRGPWWVESPGGGAGPPACQAPRAFASAPRGLCGQHPGTFCASPRPGLPLYSEATSFHRPEGRLQQAPPAPYPGAGLQPGPALCSSGLPSCP